MLSSPIASCAGRRGTLLVLLGVGAWGSLPPTFLGQAMAAEAKGATAVAAELPPTAGEAFAHVVAMMGGRPALETIRSVLVQGTLIVGGEKSRFELRARRTGEFVLMTRDPRGGIKRIGCDVQGRGWIEDADGVQSLTQATREEWRLMAVPFLPLMDFRGKRLLDSLRCQVVKEGERLLWTVGGGAERRVPRLAFEPSTHRLRRIGRFTMRDFRMTEGVNVPFTIRDGAAVYQAQSVQFIQPMEDAWFARPPSPPPRLLQPD